MAEGVPGIPSRQAETRPPDSPPTSTPTSVASPWRGSIPKVKGSTRMMVMVMVMPGRAPPIRPARIPPDMVSITFGSRIAPVAAISVSSTRPPPPCGLREPRGPRQEDVEIPLEDQVGARGGQDAEDHGARKAAEGGRGQRPCQPAHVQDR